MNEKQFIQLVVHTVDGSKTYGNKAPTNKPGLEAEMKEISSYFKKIKEVDYFSMEDEYGEVVYFNPDNIVSIKFSYS